MDTFWIVLFFIRNSFARKVHNKLTCHVPLKKKKKLFLGCFDFKKFTLFSQRPLIFKFYWGNRKKGILNWRWPIKVQALWKHCFFYIPSLSKSKPELTCQIKEPGWNKSAFIAFCKLFCYCKPPFQSQCRDFRY